jgi:hypothetical protein
LYVFLTKGVKLILVLFDQYRDNLEAITDIGPTNNSHHTVPEKLQIETIITKAAQGSKSMLDLRPESRLLIDRFPLSHHWLRIEQCKDKSHFVGERHPLIAIRHPPITNTNTDTRRAHNTTQT